MRSGAASSGKRWQRRSEAVDAASDRTKAVDVTSSFGVGSASASIEAPIPRKPVAVGSSRVACVAVIGGGVAGLACAKRLNALGVSATVFDTGKRGPGGRASSRLWRGHFVDHAAQFVTTTDPDFSAAIAALKGARRWRSDDRLGTLSKAGFSPIRDGVARWVGKEGMGSIVAGLAENVDVRQDVWVPPSNGVQYADDGSWSVVIPGSHGKRDYIRFDAVVVAHNGKCAERLTSATPALEVHALLRTNFSASLPRNPYPGSGSFTLNQIYSLVFEVPTGVMPSNFDAAFVEHEPSLRWLSSNTAKLGRGADTPAGVEAWTVLSSAHFGKQHKAPQEFLAGTPKEAEVTSLLLQAVERAVGLQPGSLVGRAGQDSKDIVKSSKLQLWGAALPISRWASKDKSDFVWSATHNIGIAGDWLTASPTHASSIEGAWLSGTRLAEHIAGTCCGQDRGLELGEDGGVFEPVTADFGASGVSSPMWVAKPMSASGGSAKGWKGHGRENSGGKGKSKGKGKGYGKTSKV
eukprot:TRINITY_DN27676_c0_g1_i1.p1 TRINITY_DN27676_c0_g1~~TRINITY_DN27676_c0_g1_i1.p1  ORF type:complete len:521 (-),score=68.48 TRINITY_DN27676_c0_g1_i1:161-1723(-)